MRWWSLVGQWLRESMCDDISPSILGHSVIGKFEGCKRLEEVDLVMFSGSKQLIEVPLSMF